MVATGYRWILKSKVKGIMGSGGKSCESHLEHAVVTALLDRADRTLPTL